MTKEKLITIIRDSLVSGNQKEAEDAVGEYENNKSINFANWILQNPTVGRCSDGLKSWYEDYDDNIVSLDELYNSYLESKK